MDIEHEETKIECIVCQKKFKRRSALYRHLRGVHKLAVEFSGRKYKFKCPACSVTFHLSEKLRNHITHVHGVNIEMCEKWFKSFNDFQKWKDAVQDKMRSLYVSCQNKKSLNKNKHFYFVCSRSGYVTSKSAGKRKSSSKKIDGWCPSGMEVKVYHNKGVQVKFWMTHFGHSLEIDRLHLSRREKLIIANKLKEGLSHEKILDDIRHSVVDDMDIRRIHLLSRTDLYNISRSFKIPIKEGSVEKEVTNVNLWVEKMEALGEDCPIVFYKEKGAEHRMLKINDYVLVIMTKIQQKLLEKCINRVICIDDIKVCQSYNYHLMTLMTVDDSDIGCPLAFCVSNKIDDSVASLFFEVINTKVGIVTGNIFMSSDIPALYSSWQKVMGPVASQLLCTWQVDRDWRRALEKPPCSEEKKIRVYKVVRQLMQEQNFGEFRSRIENTLQELDDDANLKRFSAFFKSKYVNRCDMWATCYRSQQLMHFSMILEKIHKGLIECYEDGRVINSFVRTLNLLMGFSRDKVLEKLEKLPEEFHADNVGNFCQYQNGVQEIDVVKTQGVSGKKLQVPAVEKDCCYVEHNIKKMCPANCVPICNSCNICFHRFTCTCIENLIKLNICRHIHASINLMISQCKHSTGEKAKMKESVLLGDDMRVTREEVVECTKENEISATEKEIIIALGEISSGDVGVIHEIAYDDDGTAVQQVTCEDGTVVQQLAYDDGMIVEEVTYGNNSVAVEDSCSGDMSVEIEAYGDRTIVKEETYVNEMNVVEETCINEVTIPEDTYTKTAVEQEIYQDVTAAEEQTCDDGMVVNEESYNDKAVVEEKSCSSGTVVEEKTDDDERNDACADDSDIEKSQSFLLEKIAFVHDLIKNRTFKPEEYEIFDEYFNKILEISYGGE